LEQKGVLHFVLQEFNAASTCFDGAGNLRRAGRLKTLSKKYAALKKADKTLLSDRQLAQLFNESQQVDQRTIFYLYYHHMRRRSSSALPQDYVPLAFAMLDKINHTHFFSEKQFERFKKTPSGYSLDLSKTPYSIYSLNIAGVYRRNILSPLNVKSLNMSQSNIKDPRELQGLELESLTMYDVDFKDKIGLFRQLFLMHTHAVGLSKKYYPKQMLDELKKIMTVETK
jgi:hypothetical protein